VREPAGPGARTREAAEAARVGDWPRVRALLQDASERRTTRDVESILLLAEAFLRTGDAVSARIQLEASLPMLERVGGADLRKGLTMLGAAYRAVGAMNHAEAAWNRAVDLAHDARDQLTLARATNNLGIIANIRGDRRAALAKYQLAIPAYQSLGHVAGLAESFHNMAISYRDERDLDHADEYEQRAIEYAVSAANPRLAAAARLGRAEVTFRRGDVPLAVSVAERVAQEFEALGDPVARADAIRLAGLSYLATGQVARARAALESALGAANEYENTLLEAECQRAFAQLRLVERDMVGARKHVARALALYEQLGATSDAEETREWASDHLSEA
jgi:tetratricopeptide (TPR) repeat protein